MTDPAVRTVVTDTIAEVLGVHTADLATTTVLSDLPTYNSFRIVEIVEIVEERLGVEVDAGDLIPDNLTRLDALCALFERTAAVAGRV